MSGRSSAGTHDGSALDPAGTDHGVTERDPAGAVFDALADPMRRRLLQTISGSPATATELAGELPITRQAVAKHLTALSQAGLLQSERSGRDVRYHVTPAPLSDAVSWMAGVGGQWDERLARLAQISPGAGTGPRRLPD